MKAGTDRRYTPSVTCLTAASRNSGVYLRSAPAFIHPPQSQTNILRGVHFPGASSLQSCPWSVKPSSHTRGALSRPKDCALTLRSSRRVPAGRFRPSLLQPSMQSRRINAQHPEFFAGFVGSRAAMTPPTASRAPLKIPLFQSCTYSEPNV